MKIFIPTCGRSDRQVTWENLPHKLKFDTYLVVQDREKGKYENFQRIVLPPEITSIGPTRQWIIDTNQHHLLMLDDDLDFAVRRADEPTRFRPATDEDIIHMVEEIHQCLLEQYPMVGVSAREGANYDTSQYRYHSRQMRVHGINPEILRQLNVRFDRIEFMEDFDVLLQLLQMGYTNKVVNGYVHNQRGGSNAPGGCSTTRTLDRHNEAAKKLAQLHPKFVKVVEKDAGNWGGPRLDVKVAWKKAFEYGR